MKYFLFIMYALILILGFVFTYMEISMHNFKIIIITTVAIAIILTITFVSLGISAHNEEAKEKGESVKGYNLLSVLSGSFIAFFVILWELIYDFFFKGRHER